MERVKFFGHENEIRAYKLLPSYMQIIKLFKMNQTAAEWESQPITLTDLSKNISLNDLSGIDMSNILSMLDNFEMFGMGCLVHFEKFDNLHI
jgi:hypothetical protein